nr:MAG TPA: hypothetical protein [Bacteriophage sp.]
MIMVTYRFPDVCRIILYILYFMLSAPILYSQGTGMPKYLPRRFL